MAWISTYTGKQFYPLSPNPGDVSIYDIAHQHAQTCRWNGHCVRFFSVADHCLNVATYLYRKGETIPVQLAGLLHDSAEAYISDLVSPMKEVIRIVDVDGEIITVAALEHRILDAVFSGLGIASISAAAWDRIKLADRIAQKAERKTIMVGDWEDDEVPHRPEMMGYTPPSTGPYQSELRFLERFEILREGKEPK